MAECADLAVAQMRIKGVPGTGVAVTWVPFVSTCFEMPCRTPVAPIMRLYTPARDCVAVTTDPTAAGSLTFSCPTASSEDALYVGVRAYPSIAPRIASPTIGAAARSG